MPVVFWIVAVPVFILLLIETNPVWFASELMKVKKRYRQYLIRKHGPKEAEELFEKARRELAEEGFESELVEKAIDTLREEVVQREGERVANQRLGEESPMETFF